MNVSTEWDPPLRPIRLAESASPAGKAGATSPVGPPGTQRKAEPRSTLFAAPSPAPVPQTAPPPTRPPVLRCLVVGHRWVVGHYKGAEEQRAGLRSCGSGWGWGWWPSGAKALDSWDPTSSVTPGAGRTVGDLCPEGLVGIQDEPRLSLFKVRTLLVRGMILQIDSSLRRRELARFGSRVISPLYQNDCFQRFGIDFVCVCGWMKEGPDNRARVYAFGSVLSNIR